MLNRILMLMCGILLLSQQVWAVGFGEPALHSHLGEPLDVRVPLLLGMDETLGALDIRLATPQEYQSLEQALPISYPMIRLDIENTKGAPEVHIHSSYAIDEAILVLVLKVKRGRGVFYKKMQFFLDSPHAKPLHTQSAWVGTPSKRVQYTPPASPKMNKAFIPLSSNDSSDNIMFDGGWARRNSYGPVQRGDSLSEIAYRLRKDKRYTNHQVSLALFDANPQAFQNHDINRLKQGEFLQVPDDKAVQDFIQSPRYQAVKDMRVLPKQIKKRKKKMDEKAKQVSQKLSQQAQKQTSTPQYHGKISLGLVEDLNNIPTNPDVLRRLDKLEPMYQKAMAVNLRMDDVSGHVEDLAKEVSLIHRKLDALARAQQQGVVKGQNASGWFWFMVLLVLNVFLIAAYFYRRQMKSWQEKLMEARRHRTQTEYASSATPAKTEVYQPTQHEHAKLEDEVAPVAAGLDEYDSMLADDVPGEHIAYEEAEEAEEVKEVKEEKVDIFHPSHSVNMFEEMVHKKDWVQAEKYYELMDEKQREKPRMQALWVQVLHGADRKMERNLTLLNLSKVYSDSEWSHFSSCFDHQVWREMQNEKIISYTGKVVESEVDKMNQAILLGDAGEPDDVADLAFEDPNALPDFHSTAYFDGHDPMKDDVDDAVVDMGMVDDADVEPIVDIIDDASQEDDSLDFAIELDAAEDKNMDNGEDDTVVVTPDMLAALEKEQYKKAKKSVEQDDELSLAPSQGGHVPDSKDKGDTVLVSREKMDKFRKYLDK